MLTIYTDTTNEIRYRIECKVCGRVGNTIATNETIAREAFTFHGWDEINEVTLCKKCAKVVMKFKK